MKRRFFIVAYAAFSSQKSHYRLQYKERYLSKIFPTSCCLKKRKEKTQGMFGDIGYIGIIPRIYIMAICPTHVYTRIIFHTTPLHNSRPSP